MVMPGDTITFKVKLLAPIAMEQGLRFAIREGGRTVGAGVVTKINKVYERDKLNERALLNLFRAVIANNKAGGWRKLAND
jgi:hypothetical protein